MHLLTQKNNWLLESLEKHVRHQHLNKHCKTIFDLSQSKSVCFLRYQPKSGWRCEEKNPLTYTGMTDSPAGTSVLIVLKERGLNGPKEVAT